MKIFENFLKISSQIQFGIISITFYIDFLKDISSIFLGISGFIYNLYNYTLFIFIYYLYIFNIGLVIKDWILLTNVLKEGILTING